MPLRRRKALSRKRAMVKVGGRDQVLPTLEEQCDELCRALVFLRDGRICRRCRLPKHVIHWHHIVGRQKKAMKHDPANCLTLCAGCHLWWHTWATAQDHLDLLHRVLGLTETERLFLRKRFTTRAPDLRATMIWLKQALDNVMVRATMERFPGDPL